MLAKLIDHSRSRLVYHFSGCTADELENRLNLFFHADGYRLLEGKGATRTYAKGNRVLRQLFGSLAPYHLQSVTLDSGKQEHSFRLNRATADLSGRLGDLLTAPKEFDRLSAAFSSYFQN